MRLNDKHSTLYIVLFHLHLELETFDPLNVHIIYETFTDNDNHTDFIIVAKYKNFQFSIYCSVNVSSISIHSAIFSICGFFQMFYCK